jgi:hypothetical protein
MKKLILISLLLISFNAFAGLTSDSIGNAGFNMLTDAQKAEVIKIVAGQAEKNQQDQQILEVATKQVTPDEIEKWANIGKNIGQGLGAAAKELGIAVNDFAASPIGKLATLLIVWNFLGSQIIHIIGAFCIWGFGFYGMKQLIALSCPPTIVYSKEKKNIFGNPVIESITCEPISDNMSDNMCICGVIVIVGGLIALFTGS